MHRGYCTLHDSQGKAGDLCCWQKFAVILFDKGALTKHFPTQRHSFLGFLRASKQICGNIIKRPERKTTDYERRVTKEKKNQISSEGDGEATSYETNTWINYASGRVTTLTARQVCLLMIAVLKLLAQVWQCSNEAQQGNVPSTRWHTTLRELAPFAVKAIFIFFLWFWSQPEIIDFQRNAAQSYSSPGNNRRKL